MPKLLQINSVVNTGSTGRIVEQLGLFAISQGWESYIAFGREARDSKSHLIKIGSSLEVYTHAIATRFFDLHGLMSKWATKRFLKKLDVLKPDVVHIHNLHGYYVNFPMLFKYLKAHDIPTVITMHDFWLMTGHCSSIKNICDKWKTGCNHCPMLSQYPSSMLDRSRSNWRLKASLYADLPNETLLPVSDWLSRYVALSMMKSLNRQVISNGIDTSLFKPYVAEHSVVSGVNWSKFSIMVIATRWTQANGYKDIIELSKRLPVDCQIVMVGLNDEQLREIPANIVGFKKIENLSQLQELYTKSDVLFNQNKDVTFGLVTAEAMACGTPAIVLKGTAGEEIVDERTGFVVQDYYQVIDIIPNLRKLNKENMAKLCRERVLQMFDSRKQFQKFLDLYNQLLQNRKN